MSNTTVPTSFTGLMDSIDKSKHRLAPVYEAVTNSLEAIFQKQKENGYKEGEKPEITITFNYAGLLKRERLDFITITDNGLGFNDKNYSRFQTLLDKTKGYNNRGSGRIQYVHRFSRVDVESYYFEDGKHFKRSFSCNASQFIYNPKNEPDTKNHPSGATVTLMPGDKLEKDQEYYDNLQITDIVKDLKRHFLLRFYLKENGAPPDIKIVFTQNSELIGEPVTLKPEDMPQPTETGDITVSYLKLRNPAANEIEWQTVPDKDETLHWAHFKLSDDDLDRNAVYLCSKGVSVAPLSYEGLKKTESVDGYRFLTAFYGDVLNKEENVSHSVDSFRFPDQKQIESGLREQRDCLRDDEEFLFFDTIKQGVKDTLPRIYKDLVQLKTQQDHRIEDLAREHGISLEIARKVKDKIGLDDTEDKIADILYEAQSKSFSKENQKIRKIYKAIEELNPHDDHYQSMLEERSSELLEMIPARNKDELGRYIIRRDIVASLIKRLAEAQLASNSNDEAILHNALFRKNKTTDETDNDLWFLDEELLHFKGASDKRLVDIEYEGKKILIQNIDENKLNEMGINKSHLDKKPDVLLFPEEEKAVLIEFKAPRVPIDEHLLQLKNYCALLANFSNPQFGFKQFHAFYIGEKMTPLFMKTHGYIQSCNGDLWYKDDAVYCEQDDRNIDLRIEVMTFLHLSKRASVRNKSFADKLGLRELLKDK